MYAFMEPRAWKLSIILAGGDALSWAPIRPLSVSNVPSCESRAPRCSMDAGTPRTCDSFSPGSIEVPTQVNPPITCVFFCLRDEEELCGWLQEKESMDADQQRQLRGFSN